MEVFEYNPEKIVTDLQNLFRCDSQMMDLAHIKNLLSQDDIWAWCSVKEQIKLIVLLVLGKNRFLELVRKYRYTIFLDK